MTGSAEGRGDVERGIIDDGVKGQGVCCSGEAAGS